MENAALTGSRHRHGRGRCRQQHVGLPGLLVGFLAGCLLCCTLWWSAAAHADPQPELIDPVPHMSLAPYLYYWCDGDGEASLSRAQQADFVPLEAAQITFGYRRDACWFRTPLSNEAADTLRLWLGVAVWLLGLRPQFYTGPLGLGHRTMGLEMG